VRKKTCSCSRAAAGCSSNGEDRTLETWDFVHFPAGVTHVVVGLDGPCAVLFIGHREDPETLFYPESELARRYGAEAPSRPPIPRSRIPM
jgi:hypothetical protein